MKHTRLLLILGLTANCLSAQSELKPGYVVDEGGRREAVRILDRDWVDNPRQFRYETADGQRRQGTTANIREFGYEDASLRYLGAVAAIDRSSDRVGELSSSDQPEYRTDTVFLEWLVDGEADLFYWEDGELQRFFYRLGTEAPRPLINRRYRSGQTIVEQSQFRGQLRAEVSCDFADAALRQLSYRRRDLVSHFERYNECRGVEYRTTVRKPEAGGLRLYLRPGATHHFGNVSIDNGTAVRGTRDLIPTVGARLGLEVEAVIPFANQNWSVFGELYLQRVSSGRDTTDLGKATLNLRSLNVPLGIRRYFHLDGDRALFVQALGLFQFPWKSYTFLTNGRSTRSFDASWNFGFGAGAGYRSGRWLLEVRYTHDQDILQRYVFASTYYRSVGLVAGYRLLP